MLATRVFGVERIDVRGGTYPGGIMSYTILDPDSADSPIESLMPLLGNTAYTTQLTYTCSTESLKNGPNLAKHDVQNCDAI